MKLSIKIFFLSKKKKKKKNAPNYFQLQDYYSSIGWLPIFFFFLFLLKNEIVKIWPIHKSTYSNQM